MITQTTAEWDKTGNVIRWCGKAYSWFTFYGVDMKTRFLLSALEAGENLSGRANPEYAQYLVKTSYLLGGSLHELSSEGVMEAFYASLALQRFLETGNEQDCNTTRAHLEKIRGLLSLEKLFKRKSDATHDIGRIRLVQAVEEGLICGSQM